MFRMLTLNDLPEIERVFNSRPLANLIGVNWTAKSIKEEMATSQACGLFAQGQMQAFILYKDMGSVIDILLIFSRSGSRQAAHDVLRGLIDAQGQLEEVWLEVHEDNQKAIAFYEREGFLRVGYRPSYYPQGKAALNFQLKVKPS